MASISVNTAALAYHPKKWEDFVAKWLGQDDLSDKQIRRAMVEAAILSNFHTGPQLCFSQANFTRNAWHPTRVHIWVGISVDSDGYHFLVNGKRSSVEPGTHPKLFYRLSSERLAADKSLGLIHSQLAELQEELMESQKELDASSSNSDDSSSE